MKTSELNKKYIKIIHDYDEQTLKDILKFKEELKFEADQFDTMPVEFLNVPKLFTGEIAEHFERVVETMNGILNKVIRHYLDNAEYRRLFKLDPLIEKLILSPCGYDTLLPIARIDLFYNEDDGSFKFCEFNTDGSSGMAEETDIVRGLMSTYAFYKFSKSLDVSAFELYDSWVDEFLKIYFSDKNKTDKPLIAIVDFLESGISNEFETFRKAFEKRGYPAITADIRKLEYKEEDRYFYYNGKRIDAIYRRAVTGELIAKKDSCPQFINGAMDTKTAVIGHFRTQVAHVKILFAILNDEATYKLLTDEEIDFVKKHIPFTTTLSSGNYDYNEVLHHKDKWIIKPSDMYASKNVYAGVDLTDREWLQALQIGIANDYLLQEFVQPYVTENCYFDKNNQLIDVELGNITGLYMYNGKFAGIFSRAGRHGIISAQHDGFSLGSMVVRQ